MLLSMFSFAGKSDKGKYFKELVVIIGYIVVLAFLLGIIPPLIISIFPFISFIWVWMLAATLARRLRTVNRPVFLAVLAIVPLIDLLFAAYLLFLPDPKQKPLHAQAAGASVPVNR